MIDPRCSECGSLLKRYCAPDGHLRWPVTCGEACARHRKSRLQLRRRIALRQSASMNSAGAVTEAVIEAAHVAKTEAPSRRIAVLCVTPRSVYKHMAGLDCYDRLRDAFTFRGGMPVIAHPPCKLWSSRVRHQAKCAMPELEKALGIFCVRMVQLYGGIVEQPDCSDLFRCAGVKPQVFVSQALWGHKILKRTALFFSRCEPLQLPSGPIIVRGTWKNLSDNQRCATPAAFASWLVASVRAAGI